MNAIESRITEYLSLGGLVNPEMMTPQHEVTRLMIDAREALKKQLSENKRLSLANCDLANRVLKLKRELCDVRQEKDKLQKILARWDL